MTDAASWMDEMVDHRHPMQPIATEVLPALVELSPIKAVIFDVYGTLVISGSGDVGSANQTQSIDHIRSALEACKVSIDRNQRPTLSELKQVIVETNLASQNDSCPNPEVDIVDVWRRLLIRKGLDRIAKDTELVVRLATAYESRANSTWPMPGAAELLRKLQESNLTTGIVSNAQIFTPGLLKNLVSKNSLREAGFDLDLCLFSNRFRQSKPGPRLFEVLTSGLARRGISPSEAIYVGNDMLNDVYAASVAGLKTAWFVGDARSCRPRQDDERCRDLRPNVTLTKLSELLDCLR